MLDIFNVTITQTTILFIFIALGFWLKKTNKVTANFSKGLSVSLVNIFSPMLSIRTFANNFKADTLVHNAMLLGVAIVTLLVCVIIGFTLSNIFARKKGVLDRNMFDVYIYSMSISNLGYFGYPLIESLFGEQMLANFMIFCLPFNIFIYTFGIYILNPNKVFSLKKILNLPMIGMFIGMILGLLEVKFPFVISEVLTTGGDCMAPVAMILTGVVFASNDLKSMVSSGKVYLAFAIKLLILPILLVPVLMLLGLRADIAISIMTIFSLPAGLNSIVFPEAFGGDSRTGAQLCFVSTIACVFTIPIVYSLFLTYVPNIASLLL